MTKKTHLTIEQVEALANALLLKILELFPTGKICVYGVPRGGVPVALAISAYERIEVVASLADADVVVDDIIDSGQTRERVKAEEGIATFALIDKTDYAEGEDPWGWVVFPWEDNAAVGEDLVTRMLQLIGEDPTRSGIIETPKRVTKAWSDMFSGYAFDDEAIAKTLKTFEDGAEKSDQMVLITDIPLYSKCEHHMETIFGVAHVAYIPNGKIVGLSKMKRLVDIFSNRLQVQERLTTQIADAIDKHLDPLGVGVVIQARHMCMEARGVRTAGSVTTTSALRGAIKDEDSARAEFFTTVQLAKKATL